jgi:hypothetical protein
MGKHSSFQDQGMRNTKAKAPNSASKAKPQGGIALDTLANGQPESPFSRADKGCKAQEAKSQNPEFNTPNKASGVMTKVNQGMANTLASKPTKDTCPKNSKVKGASAKVILACSRNKDPKLDPSQASQAPEFCALKWCILNP